MKKIIVTYLTFLLCLPLQLQTFYAFKQQAESASYQQARNEGLQSNAGTASATPDCSNCPCTSGATSNTSDYFIPPFNILLGSQTGTTINTHQLNVPNTFTLSNAELTVHIFPMSNSINNKTITYATGSEGTYIIAYTLKDPAGSMVYKEYDQNLTLKNIPHQVTLTSNPTTTTTTTTTTPTAGTFTTLSTQPTGMTTAVAQSMFIPTLSTTTYTLANRQQILNGISPLSQKFLLSIDSSGNITAIPISGTFDADNTTATTLALANNPLSSTNSTSGNAIGSIGIQFNDTTLFSFDNSSQVQFTADDLAQGLLLNVIIFPSSGGTSFPVIATLRTSDGLKFRKKAALPAPTTGNATTDQPLSSMPTNITITYTSTSGKASANPLLTTSFLNSGMSDNYNAFTIISPLNLRFMIVRNAKNNFNVIMM